MYTFATLVGRQVWRFAVVDARLGGHGHDLGVSQFRGLCCRHTPAQQSKSQKGVLAQLVERLNGIEEVRGSNPLGSKSFIWNDIRKQKSWLSSFTHTPI